MANSVKAALLVLCLALAACGSPITVERVDARTVQAELTGNALSTGRLSGRHRSCCADWIFWTSTLTIHRRDPGNHAIVAADAGDRELLFALAEMAFLDAERSPPTGPISSATVVYSYAFLFPALSADRPNAFDPRLRTAADLYNRALTRGLASGDDEHVDLRTGDYALPFGSLSITLDPDSLRWAGFGLTDFVPAAELHIEGLQNRYR